MSVPVTLHVLGSTRVSPDAPLTSMQRTILAAIALRHPRPTSIAQLTELVWPDGAPTTSRAALQNQISRLRNALPPATLETHPEGYRWIGNLDISELDTTIRSVESHIASGANEQAFVQSDEFLATITGPAFADLPDSNRVITERERVRTRKYVLENLRLSAAISERRVQWAVVEAERLAQNAPYDELRHALYARALLGVGRSAEGLRVISTFRRLLRDELGLTTTAITSQVEQDILHGDGTTHSTAHPGATLGREKELNALLEHLTAGNNVIVTGEPGIGVSTLLSMVAARMPRNEWTTVLIRNTPMFDAEPLEVLSDILTSLDAQTVEPWLVLSQFEQLIHEARGTKKLLLIVDDAENLGPSSSRALEEATRTAEVVLLCGTHSRPASDHDGEVVTLEGLSAHDIAELLMESYQHKASAQHIERLHQATAGNPLLLHALVQDGATTAEATNTKPVRDIVHNRLSRLSPNARNALNWLAVCNDTIPPEVLKQVQPDVLLVGEEDPELIVASTLGFRHSAVREIIYHDLPEAHRSEIHHVLATLAAEAKLNSNIIAIHALAAAKLDSARAFNSAITAATDASAIGAHLDAASILRHAIDALPVDMPEQLNLRIAYGDSLRLAGDRAHLAILQEAAGEALRRNDADCLAAAMFALLQLGATSGVGSTDERTENLTEQSLTALTDPEHIAVVSGAASLAHSMSGNADEAFASFERAEQLAKTRDCRDAVLPFAYLALGHPDHRERRASFTGELIASGRSQNKPYPLWEGLHQRFSQCLLYGDRFGMQEAHEEMKTLMPFLGDVGRVWSIRYQEAALAHLDGDADRAEELAFDAFRIFSPVSEARATAALYGQILGIYLSQNRTPELADTLRNMLTGQPSVPAWHAALAHATALSDAEESRAHLRLALEHVPRDFTWLATHVIGARAAALLEDVELAGIYCARLAPYSGLSAWQGTCTYGPVDTALALAARVYEPPLASGYAEKAREFAKRLGAPHYIEEANALS